MWVLRLVAIDHLHNKNNAFIPTCFFVRLVLKARKWITGFCLNIKSSVAHLLAWLPKKGQRNCNKFNKNVWIKIIVTFCWVTFLKTKMSPFLLDRYARSFFTERGAAQEWRGEEICVNWGRQINTTNVDIFTGNHPTQLIPFNVINKLIVLTIKSINAVVAADDCRSAAIFLRLPLQTPSLGQPWNQLLHLSEERQFINLKNDCLKGGQ